jgi:long-chain fatty acid transport protein
VGSIKFNFFVLIALLSCPALYAQTGHVAHGVGAINQSMAGAGTALPLDATGALFWNPASITDLKSSEVDINADLVLIDAELSSSLAPNTLGPGLPPLPLAGSSQTTADKAFLASIAWAHVPKDKKWAYGVYAGHIGGFSFDYKNNGRNPITTPPPPLGLGVGEIFTTYTLIQVSPTLAYRVTNHLSVAVAPNLDFSILKADPFPFTSPDDANHDGFPTFPQSNRERAFGGGVQGSLYYKMSTWQVGFSLKSPQWFQSFDFEGRNELGAPRSFKFTLNYPMILTAGIGYSGPKRLDWASAGTASGFLQQGYKREFPTGSPSGPDTDLIRIRSDRAIRSSTPAPL